MHPGRVFLCLLNSSIENITEVSDFSNAVFYTTTYQEILPKNIMLSWAIILLVIALVAGALGLSGVMAAAIHIAWIIASVAVVLFIVHAVTGERI